MTTAKRPDLTPVQLAWCQQRMPAFAAAYTAVLRRDADVAANRAAMTETRPKDTALSTRPPLRLRLAAKAQRVEPTRNA